MKRVDFNLGAALDGHPLITREGRSVTGFLKQDKVNTPFGYEANVDGRLKVFTRKGKFKISTEHELDLFMKVEEWTPKYGEEVLVRDDLERNWVKRIFVANGRGNYVTVARGSMNMFIEGNDSFATSSWTEMKQVPKLDIKVTVNGKEVTHEEALRLLTNEN